MFNLEGTPYSLEGSSAAEVRERLEKIEERMALLRRTGTLSERTVRDYYGEKRFEQVAESNALEGSTLSVGETELAVLKGITITGHDPAYVRDAVALDRALSRISELAHERSTATNLEHLHEVHGLLLGERSGAGIFRNERVIIRGARHTPPKTYEQVMDQMIEWQKWSEANFSLPAPIRSAILHAWLTHVHPYIDGNGRTSRAIGNLELIRAGYPPIIIKKKERDRYIDALSESDEAGDIRSFIELVFDRLDGALTGLEQSAARRQGYNPAIERMRLHQEAQLKVWEASIKLLASIVEYRLSQQLEPVGGSCDIKVFDRTLDIEEYMEVCAGRTVSQSWAFAIRVGVPGLPRFERLAYVAPRSVRMYRHFENTGGPSLYWSRRNADGFPKWLSAGTSSPYAVELSLQGGNGDQWYARRSDDTINHIQTTELAECITRSLLQAINPS